MEEHVIIVNQQNEEIGIVPRSQMRDEDLLHRASYVIILNSKKQLLVQKRSLEKDLYPGYYDPTTGGVIRADESYEENARRELNEELGIEEVHLHFIGDFLFQDDNISVWGRVFYIEYNGDVQFNDGEVIEVDFVEVCNLNEWLSKRQVMPDGKLVLHRYLDDVLNALK